MDEIELNRAISLAAFRGQWDEYHMLKSLWIDKVMEKRSPRPAPDFKIFQNCIEFWLQRVSGDNYYYVRKENWNPFAYEVSPRPLREIVVSEIRIGAKALKEALLLEGGGYEEDHLGNINPLNSV